MDEKVLVLGGTGFLGKYFVDLLGNRAVVQTTRRLNVRTGMSIKEVTFHKNQTEEVRYFLEEQNCGVVLNCSALADVEKCESDPEMAYWMNCELPGILASTSKTLGSKFVHFSTDAVFNGTSSFRKEDDPPSPLSVYGKSKLGGELLVLENNPESLVLRVNFFGNSQYKQSLFNFFYGKLVLGETVPGYDDVFFTPLYAADLAKIVLELVDKKKTGLFHLVGNERISKFDFGVLIADTFGFPIAGVEKSSFAGRDGSAIRPLDLSLANDKVKSIGVNLPTVQEGLSSLKKSMK